MLIDLYLTENDESKYKLGFFFLDKEYIVTKQKAWSLNSLRSYGWMLLK